MGKKEIDKVVEAVDRCVVRQSGAIIGRMGPGTVRERGLKIGRKRSDTIIQRMSQTRRGGSGAGGVGVGVQGLQPWPLAGEPAGGGGVRTGTSRREHVASKSGGVV